jgi:hypothetical protein
MEISIGPGHLPAASRARQTASRFTIVDVSIEPYDGNPATPAIVRSAASCRRKGRPERFG